METGTDFAPPVGLRNTESGCDGPRTHFLEIPAALVFTPGIMGVNKTFSPEMKG
jgi:hypothetical protein